MEIVFLGHITNDTVPRPHVGGGVVYSAIAAKRLLGSEANVSIITKCPPNHGYIKEIEGFGIKVHNLSNSNKITTFENFYDQEGNRRQRVLEVQEDITVDEYEKFSSEIKDGSLIVVAPVIDEVDPRLFPKLAQKGTLAVTPQGYFRRIGEDSVVRQRRWPNIDALKDSEVVILSDEDIGGSEQLLQEIAKRTKTLVLTEGKRGSRVFKEGKEEFRAKIFELEEGEVNDPTGAGDTYATAFLVNYRETGNLREAAVFASLVAAIKVDGEREKRGIETIPTLEQVRGFIDNNRGRYSVFLEENGIASLSFMEGNKSGRKEVF